MKASTFADLVDTRAISRSALDDALVRHAPLAIAWCDRPGAPLSRHALSAQLIETMPEAFHIGLMECIVHRWLPMAGCAPATRVDLSLDLAIQPKVDLMHHGWPERTLLMRLQLRLQQAQSSWAVTPGHGHAPSLLELGEPRAWLASLSLYVADAGAPSGLPTDLCAFHQRQLEVFLPPGPWPLGLLMAPSVAPMNWRL
jgi:hypothetical protein